MFFHGFCLASLQKHTPKRLKSLLFNPGLKPGAKNIQPFQGLKVKCEFPAKKLKW